MGGEHLKESGIFHGGDRIFFGTTPPPPHEEKRWRKDTHTRHDNITLHVWVQGMPHRRENM